MTAARRGLLGLLLLVLLLAGLNIGYAIGEQTEQSRLAAAITQLESKLSSRTPPPPAVVIDAEVYTVQIVDVVDGDPDTAGEVVYASREIYLKRGQSLADEQETLLHEILHVVEKDSGYEDRDNAGVHQMVYDFAAGVAVVIHDNPALAAYLVQSWDGKQ